MGTCLYPQIHKQNALGMVNKFHQHSTLAEHLLVVHHAMDTTIRSHVSSIEVVKHVTLECTQTMPHGLSHAATARSSVTVM